VHRSTKKERSSSYIRTNNAEKKVSHWEGLPKKLLSRHYKGRGRGDSSGGGGGGATPSSLRVKGGGRVFWEKKEEHFRLSGEKISKGLSYYHTSLLKEAGVREERKIRFRPGKIAVSVPKTTSSNDREEDSKGEKVASTSASRKRPKGT